MKPEAYGLYTKKGELPPSLPDFLAPSILDIDFKHLRQLGIKHILIDLDQTLRRIGSRKIEDNILASLWQLKENQGFSSVSIVTNNYWPKRFARAAGLTAFTPFWDYLRPVRKPSQKFYARVLQSLHAKPAQTIMIGDKVHADIKGANNAGLYTVLVKPRGRDYWFDKLLLTRYRERRLLSRDRRSLRRRKKNRKV